MNKIIVLTIAFLTIASSSWSVKIDGKIWDWENIGKEYDCKPHLLSRDRAGFDIEKVKLSLGKKYLYMLIEGQSVTGQKRDAGEGAKQISVRISFKSAQSPLNRVRLALDTSSPFKIKLSYPSVESKDYGSLKNSYWAVGKRAKKHYIEVKLPIFYSDKGLHAGLSGGPLIMLAEDNKVKRNNLSDVLINIVDLRTHRLVDTMEFTIKKGDL